MTSYADFLARKAERLPHVGPEISADDVHSFLHPWQRDLVAWAVHRGRAALWADTGLGKTLMQLEWARLSGDRVLIVAPLAVCAQTVREAQKIDLDVRYMRSDNYLPGITVTNYEMTDHFDAADFDGVVLDESSILKDVTSKTRDRLIQQFAVTPRRLACTATPAPNDASELANHAEFLGVATRREMLSTYFVHDQDGWRPKGHARGPMYAWMAGWAAAVRKPSDLGYSDEGYDLPGLNIVPHLIDVEIEREGDLIPLGLGGVTGRAEVRRLTLADRCDVAVRLVNESHESHSLRSKLATWDGSRSTPRTDEPSTPTTQPSASDARPKVGSRTRTATTCAPTTSRTKSDSSSTSATTPSGATPGDESATLPTPPTGPSASGSPSSEILRPSATLDSDEPSASPPPSTTPSSTSKAVAARSAEPPSETSPAVASPSITATTRAGSGASSAAPATSDSGSSETTLTYSDEQPSTSPEPWLIWVGLNDEQDRLAAEFGDRCFSVTGSQTPEQKADFILRWCAGERPILLTKPSIAAYGMNFQHCARMAFVGLSDSYEAYYQCIRRCYRYGQTRVVDAHVILSRLESEIATNVQRKERAAAGFTAELVDAMRSAGAWRASA